MSKFSSREGEGGLLVVTGVNSTTGRERGSVGSHMSKLYHREGEGGLLVVT